ncbi:MAG: hypothetical protein CM15mP122_2520 [Bacteroidota bacterium]|nr:MAG: hypothetical protein CM15mP122_2520 [Bacteroidota bacterium]
MVFNLRKDYEMLYENEFKNDYSMGYLDQLVFGWYCDPILFL